MEQNWLRSLLTLLGFVCFVAIALWAYSKGAKRGFREAEMLPFDEDDHGHKPAGTPDDKRNDSTQSTNDPRREG